LVYLTLLLWVFFSAGFGLIFHRLQKNQHVEKIEVESSDYVMHDTSKDEIVGENA